MFKKIILSAVAIATLGLTGCSSHTPQILKDNPEKGAWMKADAFHGCEDSRVYDKERVSGRFKMETKNALDSIFSGKDCKDVTWDGIKEYGMIAISCKGDSLPYLFYKNYESCKDPKAWKEKQDKDTNASVAK